MELERHREARPSGHPVEFLPAPTGPIAARTKETLSGRPAAALSRNLLERRTSTVQALYEEHARFVWLTLQRMGVQSADLEDVAHDVFVVVHRRLDTFDATSRVTTWLFGICMRTAANYRRRRDRSPYEAAMRARASDDAAAQISADEMLLRREESVLAEQVVAQLSLEKRAVFVMFEIESLSCAEIAELMGIPVGTVYSRLHSARQQLEGILARDRRERTPDTDSADHSGGGRR